LMLVGGGVDPDNVDTELSVTPAIPNVLSFAEPGSVSWVLWFSSSVAAAVRGVKEESVASVAARGTKEVVVVRAEEEDIVITGAEDMIATGVDEEDVVGV
jgi:hypothetical protein